MIASRCGTKVCLGTLLCARVDLGADEIVISTRKHLQTTVATVDTVVEAGNAQVFDDGRGDGGDGWLGATVVEKPMQAVAVDGSDGCDCRMQALSGYQLQETFAGEETAPWR